MPVDRKGPFEYRHARTGLRNSNSGRLETVPSALGRWDANGAGLLVGRHRIG